jgi:hypothetical protein
VKTSAAPMPVKLPSNALLPAAWRKIAKRIAGWSFEDG